MQPPRQYDDVPLLSGLVITRPENHRLQQWVRYSESVQAADDLRGALEDLSALELRMRYLMEEVEVLMKL